MAIAIIDKLGYIKLKSFCTEKNYQRAETTSVLEEDICTSCFKIEQELISKICKVFEQLRSQMVQFFKR